MIRGVLFDMDGVLVDSEEFICKAAIRMFAEKGLTVHPEDFKPFVGTGEDNYIGGVAAAYSFPLDTEEAKNRTYQIYAEITRNILAPLPGVHRFIARCKERGLKLAVATSADKVKMEINMAAIGLPYGTFDQTVNGLEVRRKKPFSDIYLEAARKLGVSPVECLVAEDAVSGVSAAKAAGCRCLALTTSFPADLLEAADWIAQTLAEAPEDCLNW